MIPEPPNPRAWFFRTLGLAGCLRTGAAPVRLLARRYLADCAGVRQSPRFERIPR